MTNKIEKLSTCSKQLMHRDVRSDIWNKVGLYKFYKCCYWKILQLFSKISLIREVDCVALKNGNDILRIIFR